MQDATMLDLIEAAERAGAREIQRLSAAFDPWLAGQDLGEMTEAEEDALRFAFEKGLGLCLYNSA